jgi:hypothetical protein
MAWSTLRELRIWIVAVHSSLNLAARSVRTASNHKFRGSEKNMSKPGGERGIAVEEVRLIADLRIMHAKVHELFELVTVLKRGHEESSIRKYADHKMLEKDIQRVDDIYLWFLTLKEEGIRLRKR